MVKHSHAVDQAIGWLIRQRDPAFAEWEDLTSWLEADPANADAYAELSAKEEAVAERLANGRRQREATRPLLHRRAVLGGLVAVAASVVAVVGAYQFAPGRSLYPVTTDPGVQRTLVLAGGTTVRLNGGTQVRLDRNDPRYAELDAGEALFSVVHDASRPFRVRVGDAELVDLGTRFDVLRDDGVTEVAVAEGVVMFNPDREAVRLTPGKRLRASDRDSSVQVSTIAPDAVGSWTEGRLIYDNVPLALVASDLSRNLGKWVRADASVAARPVTAVVQIPEDREQLAPRLEKLLDITVRRTKSGWILTTNS